MEWISVKEQLPESGTGVLAFVESAYSFNESPRICICFYEMDGKRSIWNEECRCSGREFYNDDIIPLYWMPLPELPSNIASMEDGFDPPPWNINENPEKTEGWIAYQKHLRER